MGTNYRGCLSPVRLLAASVLSALLALVGCGDDGGDTTVIQTTTVVEEETGTTDDAVEELGSASEFSGKCPASREATPARTGFADVVVAEGSCDFASEVATGFADAYGPDCFEGCTKMIEGLRCETQPPIHAEVACFAARTEVRFSISGAD